MVLFKGSPTHKVLVTKKLDIAKLVGTLSNGQIYAESFSEENICALANILKFYDTYLDGWRSLTTKGYIIERKKPGMDAEIELDINDNFFTLRYLVNHIGESENRPGVKVLINENKAHLGMHGLTPVVYRTEKSPDVYGLPVLHNTLVWGKGGGV